MEKYVIGADIGTTGTKAMLINEKGEILSRAYRGYGLVTEGDGILQNPLDWWDALAETVRKCTESVDKDKIIALSLSTQGGSLVFADSVGKPLGNAVSWMDTRAVREAETLSKLDIDFRGKTGWELAPALGLCKLKMLGDGGADKILTTVDYLNFRLTGRFVIDYTNAAMTQLFNVHNRDWDDELLGIAGIKRRQLPTLVPSGELIESLTDEAAHVLGIPQSVKVISGGHDQYCASLGAGVVNENDLMIATGTAWVVLAVSTRPPQMGAFGLHIIEGLYGALTSIPAAGASMEWFKKGFSNEDYREIDQKAAVENDAPLFIPRFEKGASFMDLKLCHNSYSLARAIMEGVAFEVKRILEDYDNGGTICVTGGAAKSDLWMQILSDVLESELNIINEPDMAPVGAGMIAGRALGLFEKISCGSRRILPQASYKSKFKRYMELVT